MYWKHNKEMFVLYNLVHDTKKFPTIFSSYLSISNFIFTNTCCNDNETWIQIASVANRAYTEQLIRIFAFRCKSNSSMWYFQNKVWTEWLYNQMIQLCKDLNVHFIIVRHLHFSLWYVLIVSMHVFKHQCYYFLL
jgi:hypothetical protein